MVAPGRFPITEPPKIATYFKAFHPGRPDPENRGTGTPVSSRKTCPVLGRATPEDRSLRAVIAPPNPTEKIAPEKTRRSGPPSAPESALENPAVGYEMGANCGESGELREGSRQRMTEETGWRWAQSRANPSPPNSLLNRENTGNFRDFRPLGEPQIGESVLNSRTIRP